MGDSATSAKKIRISTARKPEHSKAVIKQFLNSNDAYFWEMMHLWAQRYLDSPMGVPKGIPNFPMTTRVSGLQD